MINQIPCPVVVGRDDRDYVKPVGREFFFLDGTPNGSRPNNKAHHIIINDAGDVFYNQSILYPQRINSKGVEVQVEVWCDFYDWDLIPADYCHGYQMYIDAAIVANIIACRQARKAHNALLDTVLDEGDHFQHFVNQADRDAYVECVVGDQVLISYSMPAGGEFFHILERNLSHRTFNLSDGTLYATSEVEFKHCRTVQLKKLSKVWAAALELANTPISLREVS